MKNLKIKLFMNDKVYADRITNMLTSNGYNVSTYNIAKAKYIENEDDMILFNPFLDMTNIFELLHHNNKDSKENGTQISYNNTVTIAGRIVHIFAPGNVTIITISASTNRINYPKVLFFGDNCEKAAQFKIGDMVRIEGNIQSSRVEPGKNLKSVSVFGDNIEYMDYSLITSCYA